MPPARSTQPELLDAQPPGGALLARNLREMAVLYGLSGGLRLGWRALHGLLRSGQPDQTLLDVAAGDGSVAARLVSRAARAGIRLRPIISDLQATVLAAAAQRSRSAPLLQADAVRLPHPDRSVDIVHCAQALHHFSPDEARRLLAECARVARRGVVVVDLRRSWPGYWGARLAACGPLTPLGRHDGPLSVLRAYTPAEAAALAREAGLIEARLTHGNFYWALAWPVAGDRWPVGSGSGKREAGIRQSDAGYRPWGSGIF
ncbi:MAG TPA: methyltransferase domain-containing protein [Herpetosiphonaceae bacterium]|nr:methyltransferase domain-containing protein [Herpetosiphonaceae bacterium]